MAILLMASMAIMLQYSRKALKQEALEKASVTLEGTAQRIDNILLSVEQATGNIYMTINSDLDDPDDMFTYSRRLVESSPYIQGCAIAFRENYMKDRRYFMAYVYRKGNDSLAYIDAPIIQSEIFGNLPYTQQVWFTQPMKSGMPQWINPMVDVDTADVEPIVTFCLPVYGSESRPIAVIGVDVSLRLLSAIVEKAKPSPNSYSTLLDRDGSYIAHPDSKSRIGHTAFELFASEADASVREVVKAMTSGQTDYKPVRLNGEDFFVFYRPFKKIAVSGRSNEELGWTIAIVYPKDDILGDYHSLFNLVFAITFIGMLLLFLFSRTVIHIQLKPLRMLTRYTHLIAQGNYRVPIAVSRQKDEIGRLQDNFQKMQRSLAKHIDEQEQLTATMQQRGEELRMAYKLSQKADRMKTTFLHNMTNQMLPPAEAIKSDVAALANVDAPKTQQDTLKLVDNIQQNGKTIVDRLKYLINISDEDFESNDYLQENNGKEAAHD